MSYSPETSAAAASDAYNNRLQSDVDEQKRIFLNGHEYKVFGYKADHSTGFHATAYQNAAPPHNIIIAYRGTDPDIKHHTRTTFQDAAVDFTMVKDRVNPQEAAARAFTQEMLDKARARGIPRDHVTVTGHSLGGTLAEIEASKFGLRGTTFNAYGAADLGYGVPEGGHQVTNYVMAGDAVSAAGHHFGDLRVLASDDDILGLKLARYLDASPGTLPPNPLLAMSLGDHSITHFAPEPGSRNMSVLDPALLARYEQNYANHKAAIDHYRSDVYQERAELAVALRNPDSHNIETTLAHLSPRMRLQLAEYHAVHIDAPIQNAVEHNRVVDGARQGLDQASVALHATGQTVHAMDERMATDVRQMSNYAAPVMPAAPLVGAVLAEGAHLHGQAAEAVGQFAADRVQGAKHVVEQGAHVVAHEAKTAVHVVEAVAAWGVDRVIDTYQQAQTAGHTAGEPAKHTYDATRQAASHGIDATHAPNDPRHPNNPNHALYNELHQRVPEASENRLLQFTAACHASRIKAGNLDQIHLDESSMKIHFLGSSLFSSLATVDLNRAPPSPQQSVQHIQHYDQQQTQMLEQVRAQNTQINQQGPMR